MNAVVSLARGTDRKETISRALELISDRIRPGKKIVIKPNFVSTLRPLAATHVDAVRAVLDYLRNRHDGQIVVADGASFTDTMEGFRNFGYLPLRDEYGVDLVDLNRDDWVEVEAYDRKFNPTRLRLSRTLVESDTIISVTPPKTHDTVIVTLSLKNVIMGGLIRDQSEHSIPGLGRIVSFGLGFIVPPAVRDWPPLQQVKDWINQRMIRSDKLAMHQGFPAINLSLFKLAQRVRPHLSIIDGTVGMEGNGPIMGKGVNLGVVIASTDFLAADTLAAYIMGFRIEEIGYLYSCKLAGMGAGDLSEMEIRGERVEDCVLPFEPHQTYRSQLRWRDDRVKGFVPFELPA